MNLHPASRSTQSTMKCTLLQVEDDTDYKEYTSAKSPEKFFKKEQEQSQSNRN